MKNTPTAGRPAREKTSRTAQKPDTTPVPAEDDVHVTHDRKLHLKPGTPVVQTPAAAGAPQAARKATAADFLAHAAQGNAVTGSQAADDEDRSGGELVGTAALPGRPLIPLSGVTAKAGAKLPTVEEQVLTPDIGLPALFSKRGKLIVPPALKGSHEILVHQNVMADADGLMRVQDDRDLERMRATRQLVALPVSSAVVVDERLPANRRYARPWTVQFLTDLARAHYARFHEPLQVNSAVRTVEFQQRLLRTNGNAAPAEGQTASPHLTGQAVDLAKHGLSMAEIAWMRGYLLPLVEEGKVDVEEEFQQACFHVSVYKRYRPMAGAPVEGDGTPGVVRSLASAIR